MALAGPKFGFLDFEATQNLYACILCEADEPQVALVSIDPADDAIQWNRRTRQFVYKCRYDEGLLLVPESLLGSQAEAEHILASIAAARDTALAPILLAGLPHKATEAPTLTVPATPDHSNAQQHQAVPLAAAGGTAGIGPSAGALDSIGREPDAPQTSTDVTSLAGRELLEHTQFAMQCLVRGFISSAETMCTELGHSVDKDKLLGLSLQQQRLAGDISDELLHLRNTSWFWEQFAIKVIRPSLDLALGPDVFKVSVESLYVRQWQELVDGLSQQLPVLAGSCLLLAQIEHMKHVAPSFWTKISDLFQQKQDRAAQKQQAEAMSALATAASASATRSRPMGWCASLGRQSAAGSAASPALSTLRADLSAVDAVWKDEKPEERGCKFWSGIEGSCMKGPQCPDAASHIKGTPSAWHAARGKVFAQQGGFQDRMGNWVMPSGVTGLKRSVPDMSASSAPSFQQSAA